MSVASVVLAVIAMIWCIGNLSRVWAPWTYLGNQASAQAVFLLDAQIDDLKSDVIRQGSTQMLTLPAMTALLSGVSAQPVVSSPDYLVLSRSIAGLQCEQWHDGTARSVIVEQEVVEGLARSPECRAALDLTAAQPLAGTHDWVAIPVRP